VAYKLIPGTAVLPFAAVGSDLVLRPQSRARRSAAGTRVRLIEGRAGDDPALELAMATGLLASVASGRRGPLLRCYRPPPTVAFGRRDSLLPGFPQAAAAARRYGFTPVIRVAGGRAAAYDEGCLVLDEVRPGGHAMADIGRRFASEAAREAKALRSLGIDARVGEVRGEYCPGEFSVNARGTTKLAGSAQKIIRGGWLLSTVIVAAPVQDLTPVLDAVYTALGLDWDPATAGSVAEEAPGVGVGDVRRVLLAAYAQRDSLVPGALDDEDRAAALAALPRHRVES
jgi:octanoyl-[GcvH]:protein N-octanoyltransferase